MSVHQCETWQMLEAANGGWYCAGCGKHEQPEVTAAEKAMQEIPEAAVEAAAEWLPHSGDCEVRPERDCTCWQSRVNLMRAALEAAAPRMLAECWDQAIEAHKAWTWDDENMDPLTNPYRPTP